MQGRAATLGTAALLALLLADTQWAQSQVRPVETLHFGIEWRLVRAGSAKMIRTPGADSGWESSVLLESAGLVSKLYRVRDDYRVQYDSGFCAAGVEMHSEEGRRRRDTKIRLDRDEKKSHYLEKDLVKDSVALEKTIDIPSCVHDVVAGLMRLRAMRLKPGQQANLPITDGKKSISARVEAQERETITTASGSYQAIRYEAHLFGDVLYKRPGRLFIWLSDDDQALPVQIRARLSFPVGNITLQLEKIEK